MLGESCTLCIVGNKIDLDKNRVVSDSEAQELVLVVGIKRLLYFY